MIQKRFPPEDGRIVRTIREANKVTIIRVYELGNARRGKRKKTRNTSKTNAALTDGICHRKRMHHDQADRPTNPTRTIRAGEGGGCTSTSIPFLRKWDWNVVGKLYSVLYSNGLEKKKPGSERGGGGKNQKEREKRKVTQIRSKVRGIYSPMPDVCDLRLHPHIVTINTRGEGYRSGPYSSYFASTSFCRSRPSKRYKNAEIQSQPLERQRGLSESHFFQVYTMRNFFTQDLPSLPKDRLQKTVRFALAVPRIFI